MKFLHRHKPAVFRFRRWSRKGYAAFCSLGKLITIGRGGKSIADASLRKQGTMSVSSLLLYGSADSMDQENPPESSSSYIATLSSVTVSMVMEALVLAPVQYQPAAQRRSSFHSTGAYSLFSPPIIHTARTILYLFHQYRPR